MKDSKKLLFFLLVLCFMNYSLIAQEEGGEEVEEIEEVTDESSEGPETIKGTFDGFENDYYSFNYVNEDEEEDSMFFNKITPEVIKMYNLKDKKFIGKTFEITFNSAIEKETDEDGDEQEFIIRTITALKMLN